MRYVSTRGGCAPLRFTDAVLAGLAPDGGLLVPERFVDIADELDAWRALSFTEVAQRVFRLYVDDIPGEVLDGIVADAFAAFDHPHVVPLVDLGEYQMLELFHGPTLSFKDVALQVLGRLFEHILRVRQGRLNIMGATSGDTGSAAIHGVRGRADINIFVLYPKGRVSAPAGAADDHRAGRQRALPGHRGQLRRLPGDSEIRVRRRGLQAGVRARRRQLHELGAGARADVLLHPCGLAR